MKYKLLLFDLDGTLLRNNKKISNKTRSVLSACRKKGLMIGIITSRNEKSAKYILSEFIPDFLISSGGAMIKQGEGIIDVNVFSVMETKTMLKKARRICGDDCEIAIDTITNHYWNYRVDPRFFDDSWRDTIQTNFEGFNEETLKMCIKVINEENFNLLKSEFGDLYCTKFSEGKWYSFSKKDSTKENAISKLCRECNFDPKSIIAFGDDYADIEMLKMCGIGVAMGNAIEMVKQVADSIIGTNNDDGVAEYLISKFNII